MKSFLWAPVRLGGEPLGNLYLTEKVAGAEFTPEDEEILVPFASQAALAIRNAQQLEAIEDEQRRSTVTSVPLRFPSLPNGG